MAVFGEYLSEDSERIRIWAAMAALICRLAALPALAEPVWDFPLAATAVEGKGDYLVSLTATSC